MQGQGPQQELRPRPEAHYKGAGPHWEGPHGPQEHYPQYQGRPAHYQAQQAPHLSPAQGPGAYPPSRWPDEVPERAREGREGQGKRRGNDPAGGTWGATGRNGLPVAENWEVEAKRHWPGPRPQERWEEGQWEGWEEEGGGNWADWEPQRGNWTNKNWNEWRGWEAGFCSLSLSMFVCLWYERVFSCFLSVSCALSRYCTYHSVDRRTENSC